MPLEPARSLLDKLWDAHCVTSLEDGRDLLFVDRHLIHDASSPQAFSDLAERGRSVKHPELTLATADHIVSTAIERTDNTIAGGREMIEALRRETGAHAIPLFDIGDAEQGVVHVTMAELGVVLPGSLVCCGDSHTCTLGALGALALAVGTSEITQILATQTVLRTKPKSKRIHLFGALAKHVCAKDVILHIARQIGANGAKGYAIEFAGPVVEEFTIEERFTLCNMASELGAATALIVPDAKTIAYLHGRVFAPVGEAWRSAIEDWSVLRSDPYALFDKECSFDVSGIGPQVSWGTRPDQVCAVDALPAVGDNPQAADALEYMGIEPSRALEGIPIDFVFLGSCTNGRLSDLRIAASLLKGKKIAPGVRSIVVPGSSRVRMQAEAEGLDQIFMQAGFEWRQSGCSMCAALNDDRLHAGQRCLSTSNRNYEGRQGSGSRTHLASPATAAASALEGCIADPRKVAAW